MPKERVVKPPRLREGATVAVIAPSSFPDYPEFSLYQGLEYIRSLGFKVVLGKTLTQASAKWYLSGDDAFRAADINWAFKDPTVDAVICARGGVGSMRVLGLLDYDAIKNNPKIFVGYSDTTSIQNAMVSLSGLPSVQGPMAAVGFGANSDVQKTKRYWDTLLKILRGETVELGVWQGGPVPLTIKEGKCSGRLVGGNLILYTLLSGSRYTPLESGDVLFLEDIDEDAWRIDNYLGCLQANGSLDKTAGVVLGEFPREEGKERGPRLDEIFRSYFASKSYPSIYNYPCCHGYGHEPTPLGVSVELDADRKTLKMLEPVTD
jgi:muramoyltetrapeptide carboxypeptidase